jgi:hypothetical protein
MRGLAKRIGALEATNGGNEWAKILDSMSLDDLERLEAILLPLGPVEESVIAGLSESDAAFLASIIAMKEVSPCRVGN